MAVAARVKPKDFFTDEEWAPLAARSSWKGIWMIAHAWLTIIAAGALFVVWPNPITLVFAVMVIGARQLGLAILMHDGAHGCLHPNLKVNDWVGHWLAGAPTNADLPRYRDYHLQHHKFAQQQEDPDPRLVVAQGGPRPDRPDLLQAAHPADHRRLRAGRPQGRSVRQDAEGRAGVLEAVPDLPHPADHRAVGVRPVVGLAGAVAAADGDLVSAGDAAAEHRRARAGRREPARSAAPCSHHAGGSRRAAADRALLRELPLRTSHVHAYALLEPAQGAQTAEAEGRARPDADHARISDGVER